MHSDVANFLDIMRQLPQKWLASVAEAALEVTDGERSDWDLTESNFSDDRSRALQLSAIRDAMHSFFDAYAQLPSAIEAAYLRLSEAALSPDNGILLSQRYVVLDGPEGEEELTSAERSEAIAGLGEAILAELDLLLGNEPRPPRRGLGR